MKYLNFSNVEELIFEDETAQSVLPPYFCSYYESWKLGKRIPMLRSFAKTAILDFLNQLQDSHIEALENYFGERIVVEKLNYNIVYNVKLPISETELCQNLCDIVGFNYYSMWRDDSYVYISFWR